mmetsp:Transcript_14602/g.31766  ORF Transcript_14602/g.31766 Transcript_14602/m.31766 type:complete len:115 (+) Transcript_14602:303-647(+)
MPNSTQSTESFWFLRRTPIWATRTSVRRDIILSQIRHKKNTPNRDSNPYLFDKMKENCENWHQFHSDDDPFIPLHEAERIRDGLGLSETYHMLPGRSHYFDYSPELLDAVLSLC